jgi:hypothetical protein
MNLLAGSVWSTLDEEKVRINEGEIDALFSVDIIKQYQIQAPEVRPEGLPHKRKHNIHILLANLKMGSDNVKDIVRVLPFKDLEAQQLLAQNLNIKDHVDRTDAFMMEFAELKGLLRLRTLRSLPRAGGHSGCRKAPQLGHWSWQCTGVPNLRLSLC